MLDEETQAFHRILIAAIPPVPRSPSENARRMIFSYQGGQTALLIIGFAFTLVGAPLSVMFSYGLPVDLALAFSGETVKAKVLSSEKDCSFKVNDVCSREVEFVFDTGKGEVKGTGARFDDLAVVGSEVEVEVLPSDAGLHRMKGETYSAFGYMGLLTWLFPLVGGAMLFLTWSEKRQEIAAFVKGHPVVGRVTFAGLDKSTKVNGRHHWRVEWSYEHQGKSYTGRLSSFDKEGM